MLNNLRWLPTAALAALGLLIMSGCASRGPVDGAPNATRNGPLAQDPVPRQEPRSRYGNGPVYEVNGRKYKVLQSSEGYKERGVASWYGTKFHGRLTSSREAYDMHALTAAHKSLPLPTFVKVENLRNGKSVIVRVNDRGPFVTNRIIDLSYAAARRLDMIKDGTSLVEVTALTVNDTKSPLHRPKRAEQQSGQIKGSLQTLWLQAGAFGNAENAERRLQLLRDSGINTAFVAADRSVSPPLYRVRIGPINDVDAYDRLVERLLIIGIEETHLISE